MAKTKAVTATPKKTASAGEKKSKSTKSAVSIEKTAAEVLKKLQSLSTAAELQAEIEWCIGSYKYDQNPAGLYDAMAKALPIFMELKLTNAKAVTAKFVTDLEKALKSKP